MNDNFELDAEELAMLRDMFFEQSVEVVDSLSGFIIAIERDPSDVETLRGIRRAVHTLKGDSSAFGFTVLVDLAHRYEDALDRLNVAKRAASRELVDLLLAGADALGAILQHYRIGSPLPPITELVSRLTALVESDVAGEAVTVPTPALGAGAGSTKRKTPVRRKRHTKAEIEAARVAAEVAAAGQATATASAMEDSALADSDGSHTHGTPGRGRATTLRVESERIDVAMNLVGELIIQRSMVTTIASELETRYGGDETVRQLVEAVALSSRTLTDLQESVMRMRLVAIDQVFRRFHRVVRDASNKVAKPLALDLIGGHTEIDKSIVEIVSDPLIHLVRNACDHGIEDADVRAAAGKPAEGRITIAARRVGNQIAVEVEDDGAGIDPNRVAAKAVERGIVSAEAIADWTDQQKIGLVFLPGFSTKDAVSEMSGRGVGMDVVKTTVESIGGTVSVSSTMGSGSRFTIKLPLTMAIVRAMLFVSGNRRFALPLDTIREITRVDPGNTKSIGGRDVLRLRDRVLPLAHADVVLGLDPSEIGRRFAFVLDFGDGRDVGLVVDRLLGEQELVLKSVDDALSRSQLVAGASILGDGGVVLILDPAAVIEQAARLEALTP